MNLASEKVISPDVESIRIIYQDDYLIAVNKPPGLLVHRSPIDRRETRFAVQLVRDMVGRHVYPVHRLDKPTSGVLLFAFSADIASELGKQMMNREIGKRYLALVRGWLVGSGMIDYPLTFRRDKIADAHRKQDVAPQNAVTEYNALQCYELPVAVGRYQSARYTLVTLSPMTGRKHQLRRHMVHLRHPILGDTTHGDGKQNKFLRTRFGFSQLALTCNAMQIVHPVTGHAIHLNAPIHEKMAELLEAFTPYALTVGQKDN